MAKEIERKFLVKNLDVIKGIPPVEIIQGYMLLGEDSEIRIRIKNGKDAVLTLKKELSALEREEVELAIPLAEAKNILQSFARGRIIRKRRHLIPHGELFWELDQFMDENEGLYVAEIEIPSPNHPLDLPDWIGKEVTGLRRFLNASLVEYPYCDWTDSEKSGM